jgi:tetratricopeptide (TPR) repeat protein
MIRKLLIVAIVLVSAAAVRISAQAEGGGGSVSRSTNDTTVKRKVRPPVKRTVPKRIAVMKTAGQYEAEGDRLYNAKDYDSALVAYQSAAKLKPTYNSVYRIGWLYNDFGQYADALPWLNRAVAMDSSQSRAFTEKGYAHRHLDQVDQAVAAFKRALDLNSEEYVAPYELGTIFSERKQYEQAEQYLLQAIRNKADYADAYEELGSVQRHQGRNDEAVRTFNKAIELDSQDSGSYMGLGDVYFYGTKEYDKAAAAYVRGLQLEPDNQVAAYNVGYAYNDNGRFVDAIPYLQSAIKVKPDYVEARAELGFAQLKLRRYPAAATTLRAALQMNNDFDTSHYYLGQVYVLTADRQSAMNEYRELQRLHSQYATNLMNMINKM